MNILKTKFKGVYLLNDSRIVVDQGAFVAIPKLKPKEESFFITWWKIYEK